jgi:hypothetical protein
MTTRTHLSQKRRPEVWETCFATEKDEDNEVSRIRRKVRQKLNFYRDLVTFIVVVGALALADGLTGGDWWVQWVAGIWGGLLLLDLLRVFVRPLFWGRDIEDRIVERQLQRLGHSPQDKA